MRQIENDSLVVREGDSTYTKDVSEWGGNKEESICIGNER